MGHFHLTEDRWCPKCEKPFLATVVIETEGGERITDETCCPDCGTKGEHPLQVSDDD